MGRLHIAGVHLSEYGLYGLLLLQPVTGMADSLLHGRGFALFIWQVPVVLARDKPLAQLARLAHKTGAYALLGLIALHAAAALVHRYVLNDGVFEAIVGKTARPH
jgi:cytochrome b561